MIRRGIGVLFCVCCLTGSVVGQNFVNVAINKTYSQRSTYGGQGPSSNAANNNTGGAYGATNCIHALGGRNHWWEVDLGRTYPVHDITVWARTGFVSRVFPSTIKVDNQTCVSMTSAPNANRRDKSMTCPSVMYGQVVRLTYKGVGLTLNLCEFQIFVPSGVSQCPAGHHGAQCEQACSDNCGGGPGKNFCYQDTGVCYDGCTGNFAGDMCTDCTGHFTGDTCTECAQRYYKQGEGCQECSSDCKDEQCDSDTGKCNGCDDGNYGDQCKEQCSTLNGRCTRCLQNGQQCTACSGHFLPSACTGCAQGYYKQGSVCQPCSSSCKNSQCDSTTGECNACPDGYYGNLCQTPCSPGCASCDQTSGNCTVCRDNSHLVSPGCTECKDGYYKQAAPPCIQCPGKCYNNTPCDKTTGHCQQCPIGRKGETCDQACSGGQYGPSRCSLPCGQCQNGTQCDPVTGQCPLCEPGFYPPLCSKRCENKTYGENCSESCGQCKGGQPCDTVTGSCTTGCKPGYTGQLCETECEAGLYGEGCGQVCTNCQVNTTCHHENGTCLVGCAPGFSGSLCEEQNQEQPIMSAAVGATIGVVVVIIIAVAVVVVIFVRRRKRKQHSDGAKGEAPVTYSNLEPAEATDMNTESQATITDDPSPWLDNAADNSVKPENDFKVETKPSVQVKADQLYENVTIVKLKPKIQSAKPSSDKNSASVVTSSQQNGVKKANASSKKKGKPLVAAKPSKERAFNAGTVTPSDPLPDYEEEDFVVSDAIYANEELYANIKPTGIRVDKLQQTVVNKLRDGSLEEEFMRMIPKKNFAVKNGERKEHHYKNRFTSILPYDKNRVELEQVDGDDASDYVNASFVRGYQMEKAYIAAQGPRDNTVDDFWRMVWQEGVTDIVMLTNVKEGNKPKCYEYWPAQGDRLTTGHMEVTGVEEETRAHFVVRTFDLKQSEGSEKRRVKQYHYQSWRDHEVPATTPLVSFWRYVRSRAPRTAQAPPLVVHCSAGVGRTGTFIALDIIYDKTQQEAEVNMYNTVDRLRDDRCHMVQNKGQYAFLHEAVVEAYMSGDSRIQMSDMDTVLPHTITHNTPSDRVDREFETLCKMRTAPTYTTANMKENRAKNRNPDALPDDKHLVYLTKHVKGRNQYINAVYMATFLQQRGSIMTQLPLQDTLVDFWRLVDGCDVNTIVSIGAVEGKKDMCRYWPKDATSTVHTGPYTINLRSMTRLGDSLCSYKLDMKTDDTSREVRVLHYAGWTGQVADNMADLLHLLTSLHTSHHDRGGKPVIVQCIDGASQSGVVCALWDVISRMTCDAELDVYMAVKQLHTVRPEALTSVEQYRYCYEVVQEFNKSNNIYANT